MYSVPHQIAAAMDHERSTRPDSKTSWNPQDRGRSLVSMRTFYAFGARSASIGGRSSSVVPSSLPAHYNAPGYSHRSLRSSVVADSPFSRNTATRATISSSYIRPTPTVPYRSSYTPMRSPSYTRFTTPHRAFSPIERELPISRTIKSPVYSPERPPRREGAESRSTVAESRPQSVLEASETPTITTPAPTVDEKSLVELDELRSRNRILEEELAKLQLKIKDGDKSNMELKRRLLESEAESKVWRTKAEHVAEPQIIEVVRPTKPNPLHHHAIDETLYDKLEMTADKLAKLNSVNDLQLLQSHIESALNEISSK
ncbi:hypothetical protein PENTCL1PPCAC_30031 [Pristionchus entomophagus]|uniref:Uncharacterized protein n=1 Tax=Pristionchus entomophagus TaxID=358040 RepID=A0AAV5UNI7_9BILA|nr:hypothetical protein PENTCL1PPCAC_30031 [Pristionchus entomophagus]